MALLVFFFLVPSLDIIRSSVMDPEFTMKHFERIYERSVYLTVFWKTVKLSLLVALATAIIGYPVAYFINLQPKKTQVLLIFLIFVPMWMSILIRSYAWMVMLGRDGVINTALLGLGFIETPAQMLYTSTAVFVAMVQILLPIQIITCYSSMTEIDMGLIRAARILGAKPRQAMLRVFFPLSFEGTITGALIVFMLSMGFFITPALVGGPRDKLIGNLIEFQVERLNWGFASALGLLLLVGTLVLVVVIRLLGRQLIKRMV
ncbi:ABC transporter permease [Rhodobacteraceae bacterium LMO-12]|nr:ABC transporter permease [Rhodobacteraceae bacterium LMO-JJ12]